METDFSDKFAQLTTECRRHLRMGQINLYSKKLKDIAKLFEENEYYKDELKILVSVFYIDLSGLGRAPYIDAEIISMLNTVKTMSNLEKEDLIEFYNELIYPDMIPKHTMSVRESLYLFQLCLDGKVEQAEYVLARIQN